MSRSELFQSIVIPTVKRANQEMPNFKLENTNPDAALFGTSQAILDSMNLITFIFILEEEFKKVTGRELKVTTQDILRRESPPFASLDSLSNYLSSK